MASNDDTEIKEKHKINPWAKYLKIGSLDSFPWLETKLSIASSEECSSSKLDIKDVDLFGFCPLEEDLFLVMCQECKKVTKVQSLECHLSECENSLGKLESSKTNSEINSTCSNDNKVSHCAPSTTDLLISVSAPVQELPVNLSIPQTSSVKKKLIKAQSKGECRNPQEKVESSNSNSGRNSHQTFGESSTSAPIIQTANKHKIESSYSARKSNFKKCKLDVITCQSNLNVSPSEDRFPDHAKSTGLLLSVSGPGPGPGPGQNLLVNSISQNSGSGPGQNLLVNSVSHDLGPGCAQNILVNSVSQDLGSVPAQNLLVNSISHNLCLRQGITKACLKGECRNPTEKIKVPSNNIEVRLQLDNAASLGAKPTVQTVNKTKWEESYCARSKSYNARKPYSKKGKMDVMYDGKDSYCAQSAVLPLSVVSGSGQDVLENSLQSQILSAERELTWTKSQPQTKSYNPSIHCGVINEYGEPCLGNISSCGHRVAHGPVSSGELLKQCNTSRASLVTLDSCTNFSHQENPQQVSYSLFTEQGTSNSVQDSVESFDALTELATLALNKHKTLDNIPKDTINCKRNQIHFLSTVCHSQSDTGQYQFYTNHLGSSSNCDMSNCDSNLNSCSTIVSTELRVNQKSKGERKEYAPQPNSCHPSTSSAFLCSIEASDSTLEQSDPVNRTLNNQFIHDFTSDSANCSKKQKDTESTVPFLSLGNKQPVKSRTSSTECNSKKSHSTSIHCGDINEYGEPCLENISSCKLKFAEHKPEQRLVSSGELLKHCSTAKNINLETVESCTNFSNLQHFPNKSFTNQATRSSVPESGQDFSTVNQVTLNKQRTLDSSTKDSINSKTNETHLPSTVCRSESDTDPVDEIQLLTPPGQYHFKYSNHFSSSNCDDLSHSNLRHFKVVPSNLHTNYSASFDQSLNLVSVISKSKGERKEYSSQPNFLHPSPSSSSSVYSSFSGTESLDLSLEQSDQIGRTPKNQILKQVTSDLPNLSNKQDAENPIFLENKQPEKFRSSSSVSSSFSSSEKEVTSTYGSYSERTSSEHGSDSESSTPKYDSNPESNTSKYGTPDSESNGSFLGVKKESSSFSPLEDSFGKKYSLSESFSDTTTTITTTSSSKSTISTPHVVRCSVPKPVRGFNPLKRTQSGLILFNKQSYGLRKALERVIEGQVARAKEKSGKAASQPGTASVEKTNPVCRSQIPPYQKSVNLKKDTSLEKKQGNLQPDKKQKILQPEKKQENLQPEKKQKNLQPEKKHLSKSTFEQKKAACFKSVREIIANRIKYLEENQNVKPALEIRNVKPVPVNWNVKPVPVNWNVKPVPVNRNVKPVAVNINVKSVQEIQNVKPVPKNQNVNPVPENRNVKPVSENQNLKPVLENQNMKHALENRNVKPVPENQNVKPIPENQNAKLVGINLNTKLVSENKNVKNLPENEKLVPENQHAKPVPENQKVKPVPENQNVKPVPEDRKVKPVPENQTVMPVPENRKVKPVPENQNVKLGLENQNVKPAPENQNVKPVPKDQNVKPTLENQSVKPIPENCNMKPVLENRNVKPVKPLNGKLAAISKMDLLKGNGLTKPSELGLTSELKCFHSNAVQKCCATDWP